MQTNKITALFLSGILLFAQGVAAQEKERTLDLSMLGRIAIQDEGRIKPLDTYARTTLLQFSGKRTFGGQPAINWLGKLLFAPWETADDKVFLINSPEIPTAIGLQPDPRRRYSYSQLEAGLNKLRSLAMAADEIQQKDRSVVEAEILRVYSNLVIYTRLRSALSFTVPHPDFALTNTTAKTLLNFPQNRDEFSFLEIALAADILNTETADLEKKRSSDWTEDEKELMRLLRNLYQWSRNATDSGFNIMPSPSWGAEVWHSPWVIIHQGFTQPQARKELEFIQGMADAYRANSQLDFNMSARGFSMASQERPTEEQKQILKRMPIELFYNRANLFLLSWIFYLCAFFAFLFSLIWPAVFRREIGMGLLVLGFLPHTLALALRIVIMARPPVTNLYETFIFVGVISVLIGILIELVTKKWLGIVTASISGFVFLAIADKFSAEGDTLKMLVAVLDSNFWLATHVLTITIGYAGCCVAGIIGHLYIIQSLLPKPNRKLLDTTYSHLLGTLGFGLTTAFLGTMLGGIWADQSWGRFWGWDPKENGALLIVLWCAIIFHAKAGRMIGPLGVAVGASLGVIIVMWAWFGVNLLSIGLHSYGFTSGLATNLAIYVILELLFLSASILILGKKGVPV